jgi:hypothetical protein
MGANRRLQRLEAKLGRTPEAEALAQRQREVLLYCKKLENYRRVDEGLDPIPFTEEEIALDRETEERFEREHPLVYREIEKYLEELEEEYLEEN